MMIRFVSTSDVLPLRNIVLRDGRLSPQDCFFPGDENAETFHVGCYDGPLLVCAASFHPQLLENHEGQGFQLRGMGTLAAYRGSGIGRGVVQFALARLREAGASYLWCNARTAALGFYGRLGFQVISEEFDVPAIGPHHVMFLHLA